MIATLVPACEITPPLALTSGVVDPGGVAGVNEPVWAGPGSSEASQPVSRQLAGPTPGDPPNGRLPTTGRPGPNVKDVLEMSPIPAVPPGVPSVVKAPELPDEKLESTNCAFYRVADDDRGLRVSCWDRASDRGARSPVDPSDHDGSRREARVLRAVESGERRDEIADCGTRKVTVEGAGAEAPPL